MVSTEDVAWIYCFHHLMACVDKHNAPPKYSWPSMYSNHIVNPHHCEHSSPIPKIIKNLNVDGNVTLENWIIEEQYISLHNINITPPTVYTVIYQVSKKLRKQTISNINTHCMIRTTYGEFQCSPTIIPQRNLTSDREIKQHIWQWKDKEDCSRSEISYVILIIWVTVVTT